MITTELTEQAARPQEATSDRSTAPLIIFAVWLILFFASLFAPSLLDDADATHAGAAQHMSLSGDWVTLHVNGIRYLEKAPLPYWLAAVSFRVFGFNTFATHLPQAIAVLLLALLGFHWAKLAFDDRTALYAGLATLTSAGVFLFTRIFIPEALLSLLLLAALFCFLKSLNLGLLDHPGAPPSRSLIAQGGVPTPTSPRIPAAAYPYATATALALAVLTKGLVALVFFIGAAALYLVLTGDYRNLRRLKPLRSTLLFLALAAPWHLLAGLRNTGGRDGHGFFWFYFINEHVMRFLGKRIPMDYNKLPGYLFWTLHLVWLFPWSLFLPLGILYALRRDKQLSRQYRDASLRGWQKSLIGFFTTFLVLTVRRRLHLDLVATVALGLAASLPFLFVYAYRHPGQPLFPQRNLSFRARTILLLSIFSALVLVFFSLSTNQEYYTFPAYLPLLILITSSLSRAERTCEEDPTARRWINFAHGALTTIGVVVAAALAYGLWTSRHYPFVPDIGDLLAHRGVGDYTLSMSALFDLTGPSFAALRLPAALAMLAFAFGPAIAWYLRSRQRHLAATSAIALTSALFLFAAHIALVRFGPMLSSEDLAAKIQELEDDRAISRDSEVILYGDLAWGSSIPFYLDEQVSLVNGRSTSMLFGSSFPDAPAIFLTPATLLETWGAGPRKLLFVPINHRDEVDLLLGSRKVLLEETSGKALFTDRPLDRPDPDPPPKPLALN